MHSQNSHFPSKYLSTLLSLSSKIWCRSGLRLNITSSEEAAAALHCSQLSQFESLDLGWQSAAPIRFNGRKDDCSRHRTIHNEALDIGF